MTQKAKHTPGPWYAHLNVPTATIPGHIIKTDDNVQRPIASLWKGGGTHGKPTQIANAHLIAAAPDMYEALVSAKLELEACGQSQSWDRGPFARTYKMVKTAIAKAKGETS